MNKIVVLIPALNPAENFIEYCENLTKNKNVELIVVDDGSKKELKYIFNKISKLTNTTLLTNAVNLGKGRALKNGFNYYLNKYPKENFGGGIITADSDGQHSIEDIISIGEELNKQTEPCIILGTRDFNDPNVPFKSRNGNKITTTIFKLLYGKKINDTQTGLRGLSYDFIKTCLSLDGERFEYEINMLIEAVQNNIKIIEHKIKTIYFNNNAETHFNPVKDSIKIYKIIFKKFFKFAISGLSSAILDVLLFTLFYKIIIKFKIIYPIIVSTILARIISSLYNYFINKNLVFKDNLNNKTIIKYYILCIIQTLISSILVEKMYTLLNGNLFPSIIKIFVDTILFLISFQIQQRWVFKTRRDKKSDLTS